MDTWDVILGSYGAILSTILAVDQLRQRRSRVALAAEWYAPKDEVHVQVINVGKGPITVRAAELVYGQNTQAALVVVTLTDESLRLEPAQLKEWILSRKAIVDGRKRVGASIGRRNFVWLRVEVFGIGQRSVPVTIDAKLIGATGKYAPAEQNIAADLLVGFSDFEVEQQPRDLVTRSR